MAKTIDTIYAYVMIDPDDPSQVEGIPARYSEYGWMPMVGADRERVESLRQTAQTLADSAGVEVTLVRFSLREIVEVLRPAGEVADAQA